MRAIIVDDEELARRGLALRLAKHADVELLGECRNAREAVKAIRELGPDVVFLDVQMPGKGGFDVLAGLDMPVPPKVVFVTAHDEHALAAFRVNALDYLLKPVQEAALEEALARVRRSLGVRDGGEAQARLRALTEALGGGRPPAAGDDTLAVHGSGRIRLVRIADIDYVEAQGDYVAIHTAGRALMMRTTLADMEERLRSRGFLRIHRSQVVNKTRVVELKAMDNGEYDVILSDGSQLKLSRSYRAALDHLVPGRAAEDG